MRKSAPRTAGYADPTSYGCWKPVKPLLNRYRNRMGNLFYTKPDRVQGNRIELDGPEARHAGKVLRYRAGDPITITDGKGTIFSCVIRQISGDSLSADIVSRETEEREEPFLAVAIGNIRKRDRLEFAAEKVTELGAGEIIIYKGDHSEKGGIREDRLDSTIESAMKQSLRSYLPASGVVSSLEQLISEKSAEGFTIVVADEELEGVGQVPTDQDKYLLVIGPEGGFSENERKMFDNCNARRYSLGRKRLRTETAAVVLTDRFRNRRP